MDLLQFKFKHKHVLYFLRMVLQNKQKQRNKVFPLALYSQLVVIRGTTLAFVFSYSGCIFGLHLYVGSDLFLLAFGDNPLSPFITNSESILLLTLEE